MRYFLLVVGLLGSLTAFSQVASTTQFGLIKVGSGAAVDINGFLNITATSTGTTSATTAQALRDAWPVTTVSNPTLANVQAAINAAVSTGAHIKLGQFTGTITGELSISGKPNLWLDGQGICNWTRSDGASMIVILGNCSKLRISGMNLVNLYNNTGSNPAIVSSYETAKLDDYEFDNNYISCPYVNANALAIVQYSSNNVSNSQRSTNITIRDNRFVRVGRMGAELLAQASGDSSVAAYITNLTFSRNYVEDCGRVNSDSHGMGVSVDGLVDNLLVDYNTFVECKNKTIEVVNTRFPIVRSNTIRNVNNQDVTGVAQSSGNSPFTYDMQVYDNNVETTGATFIYFDVHRLKMYRNVGINRVSINNALNRSLYLVRVTRGQVQGNTIRSAGERGMMLDNSSLLNISGNIITNEFNYRQLPPIYLFNSTNNVVTTNKLAKYAGSYRSDLFTLTGGTGNTTTNNFDITDKLNRQPTIGGNGVVLLVHGNANIATDIVDDSPKPKPVYKVGNPVISSAQSKYGGSSLFFDGASYLVVPNNPDWNLGTSDFTMEAFLYPTANPASGQYPAIVCRQTANNVSWTWGLSPTNSALDFNIVNNADSYTGPGPTSTTQMTINTWHHVALVSSGGTRRLYLDGSQVATTSTISSMELNTSGQNLLIGTQNGEANFFLGYMNGLRITKGTGLYTATFTPPTSF